MGEQRIVELGQEARRCRSLGIGQRGAGHVEELATALVTEADKARPEPFEDIPEPAKARPRPGISDGGGAESRQITQDGLVRPAVAGHALAEPWLGRGQGYGS